MKKILYSMILVILFFIGNNDVKAESITCKYGNFTVTVTEEDVLVKGYTTVMGDSSLKVEDFVVSGEFKCLNSIYYTYLDMTGGDMEVISKEKPAEDIGMGPVQNGVQIEQIFLSSSTGNNGVTTGNQGNNGSNSGNTNNNVNINATISCNDYELAKILDVARRLLKVATILVPVLLVVLLIMDIMKTITTADVDQKKLFKSISNRVIAAIAVFLVPYIIDFIVDIIPMGASNWRDCWGVDSEEIREQEEVEVVSKKVSEKIDELVSKMNNFEDNRNQIIRLLDEANNLLDKVPESLEKDQLKTRISTLGKSIDAETAVDDLRQYLKTSSATKPEAEKLYNKAKETVDKLLLNSGERMKLESSLTQLKTKINRLED